MNKKISKITLSLLSFLLTFTMFATNVSATNSITHYNEDKTIKVNVNTEKNKEGAKIKLDVESSDEKVKVTDIVIKDESITKEKEDQYSYVVGQNGDYKFTVKVSRQILLEESSEEVTREETFDFEVNVEDIERSEDVSEEKNHSVEESDNETAFYIPSTDKTIYLTDKEIENKIQEGRMTMPQTMSMPSSRATGFLNVPNAYQGEFWIDSYSGGWQGTHFSWGIAFIDGNVAYCLDPTRQASYGNTHTSDNFFDNLPPAKQQSIWRIAYFGYGYEGDFDVHRYLAAQEMIWELMTIQEVRGYGGNETFSISWSGKDGENISKINSYKNTISSLLKTYSLRPSFHNTTHSVKVGQVLTLTDSNGVLARYKVQAGKGVSVVSKSGNTLKLRVDSKNFDPQVKFVKSHAPTATSTLSWGYGDSQKVFTHGQDRFDPNSSIVKLELKTAYITAKKVDEKGMALANSTIRMSYSNEVDSNGFLKKGWDYVTNEKGLTKKDEWNNDGQTVYMQEIKAPQGYIVNKTIQKVTIRGGEEYSFNFVNKLAEGQIKLIKKSTNGTLLEGIVFDVKNDKKIVVDTITTNAQGIALSKKLPLGNYTLHEKSVIEGIVLDTTPINVSLIYKDQETPVVVVPVNVTNKYQRGNIKLTKVEDNWDMTFSKNNGKKIEGTQISLFAKTEIKEGNKTIYKADQHISTATTNAQGEVIFSNQPIGDYYAKEVVASKGYVLFDGQWDIQLKYDSKNITTNITTTGKTLTNQIMNAKSKLHKSGKGGTVLLENATFGLFTNEGQKLGEYKTDETGEITSPSLRYGTYYWQEIEAPVGYWLDDTKHYFTVDEVTHDTVINIAVANNFIEAKILVKKVDGETGTPLKNVSFAIYDESMNRVNVKFQQGTGVVEKDTWYTDSNGEFLLEANLPYGKYFLVEVEALEGYLPIAPIEFTIDENQDYINLDVIGTVLDLGSIENDRIKGDIEILKIDSETKEPVKAEFDILSLDGSVVTTGLTNEEGKLLIEKLDYGTYIVEEKWVEEPYIINPNNKKQFVTISEHEKVYTVTFENEKQEINVFKEDMEGNPIPNTEFELYEVIDNGTRELVTTVVTDETGVAKLPFLLDGKYVVIETKVDLPFVINPENKEQELIVTSTQAKYNITYKNEKATGRIERTKYDSKNQQVIQDVKYSLYDVTNLETYTYDSLLKLEALHQVTTDREGKIVIEGLDISKKYGLIEASAPYGYELSKEIEIIEFEYVDNETPTVLNEGDLFNDRTKVTIRGEKRNKETNELITTDDFILELKDKDGNVIEPKEFKNGVFVWEVDSLENYYLSEIKAPQGYMLSDEIIEINTSEEVDNNLYIVEYFNNLTPTPLPPAGIGNYQMQFAVVTMGLGIMLIYISKQNKKSDY